VLQTASTVLAQAGITSGWEWARLLLGLIPTVAIAFFTYATFRSTKRFQEWSKAQRDLDPLVLGGGFQRRPGKPNEFGEEIHDSDECDAWLRLLNPAEVPASLRSMSLTFGTWPEHPKEPTGPLASSRISVARDLMPPIAPFRHSSAHAVIPARDTRTLFVEMAGLRIPRKEASSQFCVSVYLTLEFASTSGPRRVTYNASVEIGSCTQMEFQVLTP